MDDPVELVDVMPTLCDACGLNLPNDLDGRSLLHLIHNGEGQRRYQVAQTCYREGRQAVSNPAKRAILVPGRSLLIHDSRARTTEWFDLQADARGLVNVKKARPGEVVELITTLASHDPGRRRREFVRPATPEISEDLKRQLSSLGYIGESATEHAQWDIGG